MAGGFARLLWPLGILAGARGLLFPWVPVFIGIGIAIWFALPFEPGLTLYAAIAAIGFAALLTYRLGPELGHPLAVIVLCLTAGVLAAGYRAHSVNAPMLEFRYYGPVQGLSLIHIWMCIRDRSRRAGARPIPGRSNIFIASSDEKISASPCAQPSRVR